MHVPAVAAALGIAAAGCSPAFDWRDVRLAEAGAAALFPCKPAAQTRRIPSASGPVAWTNHVCVAGGATFAFGSADFGDAAAAAAGLERLAWPAGNVAEPAMPVQQVAAVRGAAPGTPKRLQVSLRGDDGQPLVAHRLVFARGTIVCLATVVGSSTPPEVVETYFSSLRIGP